MREQDGINIADVAASFQAAAVDMLLIKTKQALKRTRARRLVLAGGVAANRLLRERLVNELDARGPFCPRWPTALTTGP